MDKKMFEFYFKTSKPISLAWKIYWKFKGCPVPPPHTIKENIVKEMVKKYKYSTFIETGTRHGYMVFALRKYFKRIFSIELSPALAQMAIKRFKRYDYIKIYEGDSSICLPIILDEINESCIFWLDAHYSAGETAKGDLLTPINKEMEYILKHRIKDNVLLIDDARDFNGTNDYPHLEDLEKSIKSIRDDLVFEVKHDVICIQPKKRVIIPNKVKIK